MTTPTFAVECHGVAHTYGSGSTALVAVHDVSCAVPTGAHLAITGPSGSGKSTLLHLMAGLEQPAVGTVTWPGLEASPTTRRGVVGVVFQGPSLIPALDVVQNVALPLVLDGVRDAEARRQANVALETLHVGELARKLPEELSGGQAQRVAIARVLAMQPPLILADEPTGQLDHQTARRVIDTLIQAATSLGSTLIVSTHDPLVAEHLNLRWRMDDGVLLTTSGSLNQDSSKVGS